MSASAPCSDFSSAAGAAWPWCDWCGWRADLHKTDHPVASAVDRVVSRAPCDHPDRYKAKGVCHHPATDHPDAPPCGPCPGEQP